MPMVGPTIGKAAGPFLGSSKAPTIVSHGPQTPSSTKALPGKIGQKPGNGKGGKGGLPKAPNPYDNPIYQPGLTLQGKPLYQAAQGLTDASTNGPLAALGTEIAQGNANANGQANLAGGYFNQLGALAQKGFADTQQVGTNLNTTLGQIADQENAGLALAGQNATNALNQYTPPGGDNAAGMSQLQQTLANASGLAAQNEGTNKAYGAQIGGIGSQLAGSELGVDALAGTQAIRSIYGDAVKAQEPLNAQMASLQANRSALLAKNIGALRQQEVANGLARQTLGIKATTANNTANYQKTLLQEREQGLINTQAYDKALVGLRAKGLIDTAAYQKATLAERKWAATQSQNGQNSRNANTVNGENYRAQLKAAAATGKPQTAAANLRSLGYLGRFAQTAKTLIGNGYTYTPTKAVTISGKTYNANQTYHLGNAQGLVALLTGQDPTGGVLAQAAVELATTGKLSSATAHALHGIGVRGGTYNNAPIQVDPLAGINGSTDAANTYGQGPH